MSSSLNSELSKKYFTLQLWVLLCIGIISFIVIILVILSIWITFHRKTPKKSENPISQTPNVSKEIRVDNVENGSKSNETNSDNLLAHLTRSRSSDVDDISQCSSSFRIERAYSSQSCEDSSSGNTRKQSSNAMPSPLIGLPEGSHLGWGHWFTLRDLEISTNRFSTDRIIGEGGYGVVYRGKLVNGTEVAVKKLLNNLGQAEKEFQSEVEAIGYVRHKNLVRLLGYCIEGVHRMLVYEYVNNGNLEEWLHGITQKQRILTWESRIKILLGTAKALAYLHESIEPKVVHRDIKSSNILIDNEFNAKVSDFGLAKLLGSHQTHITTRVMGTFGYVAPEYANTGLLNEKSDIYSFGVLVLESVTGRDPVDYGRPSNEVNLVEWMKMMVANRRTEEIIDLKIELRPSTRSLKRILLVALKCVDPDSEKRPKMSQVVRMLESDEFPYRESRRNRKSIDLDFMRETSISGGTEH